MEGKEEMIHTMRLTPPPSSPRQIMMDMHRLEANGGIPELWYSNQYPYSRVLQAWSNVIGALQYKWNFFAVDLKVSCI